MTTEIETEHLKSTREIAQTYPQFFSENSLRQYASKKRDILKERRIVFRGQGRSLVWDEKALLRWWLEG